MITRKISKIFQIAILIFCLSCEDQSTFVKCSDCTSDDPEKTELEVKLDSRFPGSTKIIKVYEGNLEDSILYSNFETTSSRPYSVSVMLNKQYTVTATYYITDNTYIAVDSATPRVKFDKTQCDDPCYFVYDKTIDLRLKYTK